MPMPENTKLLGLEAGPRCCYSEGDGEDRGRWQDLLSGMATQAAQGLCNPSSC